MVVSLPSGDELIDVPDATGMRNGPSPQDREAQALLASRLDLQQATKLTGTEPAEGLHALLAERLSLLPPAQRDHLWSTIGAPGDRAHDAGASVAGPDEASPEAGKGEMEGPQADGPEPSAPPPMPMPAADAFPNSLPPPLSALDDRDYARAQALQFWHTHVEPLLGLAARGKDAIEAAERVLLDPDATAGEVRQKLGAVDEYQVVIAQQWEGLNRSELSQLVSDLRELRMVGGEAETARIDDLIGELAHPMPLQEFDAKREDLERAVREHRADEPRRAANRLECTLEYDNPGASPSPSP